MHGAVMENLQPAQKWLDTHARTLRNFVCGNWLDNKSVVEQRVQLHSSAENAVVVHKCSNQLVHELSSQLFEKAKQPVSRTDVSKLLKLVLAQLEQQSSLLIGLETLLTGRVVRELRSLDSASWQKVVKSCIADNDGDRSSLRVERGVVCIRLRSTSTPLLSCLSEVASSVALGNTVLVLAEGGLALTFLALLDHLRQAGAPAGVLERITVLHCDADVRVPVGRGSVREVDSARAPRATAEQEAVSSRAQRGRTVALIFEDGDLQAAANAVVESLLLANGQHSLCTRLVYVQQPVHSKFLTLLAERCTRVRVGEAADRNADVRAVESDLDAQTRAFLTAPDAVHAQQSDSQSIVPTFVSHLPQDDTDLFACNAPICFVLPFRTPFDAVALCTQRGLSVREHTLSVFCGDFSLAYELARRLPRFGAILVNTGTRMCVPSLLSLADRPNLNQLTKLRPITDQLTAKHVDTDRRANNATSDAVRACNTKLHVAGKLTLSESARLGSMRLASGEELQVSEATATDVRLSIEAARAALNSSGWQRKAVSERAAIVSQMLDQVANGASDMLGLLAATASGLDEGDASKQLSNALANLRRFAKSPSLPAARYAEEPLSALQQAIVLRQTVPHGVLTLVLGAVGELTLTASTRHFVTTLATLCAALISGNAVLLVAADPHTLLAALALHRCASVAGFNPALLSLLTSFSSESTSQTIRAAIEHHDVDAAWIVAHDQADSLARFRTPNPLFYVSDELGQHLTATSDCELVPTFGELVQRATNERLIALPFGSIFADV